MLQTSRTQKEAGDLLGTYMLQGWIMTDEICPVESCTFPLMSSKDRSLQFCTLHDSLPTGAAKDNYKSKAVEEKADDDMSDELAIRRHRREQSSKASQLIGQKMLQRWALLNEHCPNESCFAVPLVRNPETKHMYCVICENIILTEAEAAVVEQKKGQQQKKQQQQQQQEQHQQQQQYQQQQLQQQQQQQQQQLQQQQQEQQRHQSKLVHSPIVSPIIEERKRQKVEPKTSEQSISTHFSSTSVVATLSMKMNQLTERVKDSQDPTELGQLFKAIKLCANAIQACVEAGQVYDRDLA
ncbi:hypothetical protein MFLAVUS_010238 [Mucor flavus]|uniref:Uncharacterized protein n=1 Tax=Mucor flavus TaxID=439312 RepID=A0ABP9ZCA9_9FUNG